MNIPSLSSCTLRAIYVYYLKQLHKEYKMTNRAPLSYTFTGLDKLARLVYDNETIGSTIPIIQLTLKIYGGENCICYPK